MEMIKITEKQRMENDIATMDKRNIADETMRDNRNKNDELTRERRFDADNTMDKNRLRNDRITANRREIKDENWNTVFAIFLLTVVAVAVGTFFLFI